MSRVQLKAQIMADRSAGLSPEDIAAKHTLSLRSVYRHLAGHGVQTRRTRRDAGVGQKQIEDHIFNLLANLVLVQGYPTREAIAQLEGQDPPVIEPGTVSVGWFNRRLRDLNITKKECARHGPRMYRRRESGAPNVRHQADATPAAMWYFREGPAGDIMYDPPDPLKKEKQRENKSRLHIFGIIDEYSRCCYLRSYDGETAENWMDFLYRAWSRKGAPVSFPFCGQPKILYSDAGSGLVSRPMKRAMHEIHVKALSHMPGEAWCKGKIERLLQKWQSVCEPATKRLSFATRDDFNIFLEQAAGYLNSLVHSETKQTPFGRWCGITPGELVLPPAWEQWERLCLREEECLVAPTGVIKFGQGQAREEVELPTHVWITRYIGKRVKVLYVPFKKTDPIIVQFHALSGLPAQELTCARVSPGARPVSVAESRLETVADLQLREIKLADLSGVAPTRHWERAAEKQYPLTEAGRQVVIDSARLFRPEPLTSYRAGKLAREAGVFGEPPTAEDDAFIEDLFSGRPQIDLEEFKAALEELKRAREDRHINQTLA